VPSIKISDHNLGYFPIPTHFQFNLDICRTYVLMYGASLNNPHVVPLNVFPFRLKTCIALDLDSNTYMYILPYYILGLI